jgi:3-hydroxyacyl-CoA dehydrogenase/enoyl-CoA hydratase/3-hydroxybutyryl-CoA epimerase/enoyl-CoA isomerase
MDVSSHVSDVIAAGYPQRMKPIERNAVALMVAKGRFGQKSGAGFYRYENDPKGRPRKSSAPEANALVAGLQTDGTHDFGDAEIIERMMLPMLVEAAHALEEGVVGTAAELDMAMLLGVGFPPYAGGPLKYSDWLGLERVVELCKRHVHRGPQYAPTPRMREMAAAGERYYPV